ncbi:MAG: hypothetical protein K8M05_32225, partial [Deltaproteobacteria bacterium]|nr:hypothetical protein [Kofleriaceae bacterium]
MSQPTPRWHARLTGLSIAATSGLFAGLVWSRRWLSDDGLIVVRVVRQILGGNGPVFNAHERVEASTSVLWTWLLAAAGALTGRSVTRLAVELGALCALLAVIVAMDTARRWHRARGSTAALLPAAILLPLAIPPFWDFATSGLEMGLCMLWLAMSWRLLLALDGDARPARLRVTALVLGLGPLVRPE